MTYRDSRFIRELGVTIPEDLEPLDWSIYYFCAPSGIQWGMAVRTALRLLSRGRFWGRDDRPGSIKAAQKIGRLIEMSLGMCNMTELADSIRYLADRLPSNQITQTVNCGCGGGGGGGGNTVLDEPIDQPEEEPVDVVPPLPSPDDGGMDVQDKCNLAYYLADSWVNNFQDINNWWGGIAVTISSVQTWLTEKFPAGSIIPFVAMIISSLVVALEAALLAGLAGRMADAAAEQREGIICAIVNSSSPAEAKQNFESVIADTRASYGKMTYTVMILVAQMLDWNKIMGGEVIVPESYDGSDCSECLTAEGPFALPAGYEWRGMQFGEMTYEGTAVGFSAQKVGTNHVIMSVNSHSTDLWYRIAVTRVVNLPVVAMIVHAAGVNFADNKGIPCIQYNLVPQCPGTTSTQRRAFGYWMNRNVGLPAEINTAIDALPVAFANTNFALNPDRVSVANYPVGTNVQLTLKGWVIVQV